LWKKRICTFGWTKRTKATSTRPWMMKEMKRYKLHATNVACIITMKLPPRPSCSKLRISHENTIVNILSSTKKICPMMNWNVATQNYVKRSPWMCSIPSDPCSMFTKTTSMHVIKSMTYIWIFTSWKNVYNIESPTSNFMKFNNTTKLQYPT
jgi:hypothetical protein